MSVRVLSFLQEQESVSEIAEQVYLRLLRL